MTASVTPHSWKANERAIDRALAFGLDTRFSSVCLLVGLVPYNLGVLLNYLFLVAERRATFWVAPSSE